MSRGIILTKAEGVAQLFVVSFQSMKVSSNHYRIWDHEQSIRPAETQRPAVSFSRPSNFNPYRPSGHPRTDAGSERFCHFDFLSNIKARSQEGRDFKCSDRKNCRFRHLSVPSDRASLMEIVERLPEKFRAIAKAAVNKSSA